MTGDDDSQLVMRACGGDMAAFEKLAERHYDFMYRIAFRWCGNRPDAEDITHNAILKMADSLRSFRFESSFRTWLCRMVINAAKDNVRRVQKDNSRTAPMNEDLPGGVSPDSKTYTNEIFKFVQELPPEQRAALILVFGEGMTHKEAGIVEGCPEGTISWRISEARRSLEYMMEKGDRHA